jgi:hypothetical protein
MARSETARANTKVTVICAQICKIAEMLRENNMPATIEDIAMELEVWTVPYPQPSKAF